MKNVLILSIVVALHILFFQIVYNSQFTKKVLWNQMVAEQGIPMGNAGTGIAYILEGQVVKADSQHVEITNGPNSSSFTLTWLINNSLINQNTIPFESWPEKVVKDDSQAYFDKGDRLFLIFRGPELFLDNNLFLTDILKERK